MSALSHRPSLKGMTWNHPRGIDPMLATSAEWLRRTGTVIEWDKRSLQDFEAFPVAELARAYDLIVIDHPHVGQITAENCLAPLDIPGYEPQQVDIASGSVGASYESYAWAGRQWALPIDAAAQVQAWRPDRLDQPPADWAEVVALATAGEVVLPMLAPHSLMTFFTLAGNLGFSLAPEAAAPDSVLHPPLHGEGRGAAVSPSAIDLIAADAGIAVIEHLRELIALVEPSNFAMDPIAASEALSRDDALVSVMPWGYGYVSYARESFRPGRLKFADIPDVGGHGPVGSAIGGTGIAVSAFSTRRAEAIEYAYLVASGEIQRTIYARSGGQPAHAAAWDDAAVNAETDDFYRGTRTTLEGGWLRPRHRGYMAFQDAASQRLNAGLLSSEASATIVADLNRLFRESF